MSSWGSGMGGYRRTLLGPRPRSGDLSPYATKLVSQLGVLLASLVVLGAMLDGFRSQQQKICSGACIYVLIASGMCIVTLIVVLFINWRAENGKLSRTGTFQTRNEIQVMMVLVLWWIPVVAVISSLQPPITRTGEVFAWFAFFGSIYAVLKVYHVVREEEAQQAFNRELQNSITALKPSQAG